MIDTEVSPATDAVSSTVSDPFTGGRRDRIVKRRVVSFGFAYLIVLFGNKFATRQFDSLRWLVARALRLFPSP
jgi:hypothetical protein